MKLEDALPTFLAESRELLQEMEDALLGSTPQAEETVSSLFRAAHTIKGSAGLFGLDGVVAFTHRVESVLDRVRAGTLALDEELVAVMLRACDRIGQLVEHAVEPTEAEPQADPDLEESLEALMAEARGATGGNRAAEATTIPAAYAEGSWHVSVRFGREVLRNGMDPLSFLRYLGTLAKIVHVEPVLDAMPDADAFDAESCYLGLEIVLAGTLDKATIEGAFEFVRDDCTLRILPPGSKVEDFVKLISELPEDDALLGDMLVACGSLTRRELGEALRVQASVAPPATPLLGNVLVSQGAAHPAVIEAAVSRQARASERRETFIRVDADRLDAFIDLVGELVIAGASTGLLAQRAGLTPLAESASTLSRLVDELRDRALQLRMVQIGATFNRFQRVVRDVSRDLGKDIALVIEGAETELDKTVVEKIADPLMHLVRNAMDHGIESAQSRLAAGKPARGTLRLNAYHDSGSIVIEVSDDGAGLRRERILAKARERGLVAADAVLSDQEVFALVFEPGFSTAEAITNLSGRGVGMDVVKSNITALRGTVEIDSQEGRGTTVSVRLPLTLAIIDGFLVGVDESVFVIPLDLIEECIEFIPETERDYVDLRGEVLPFVRLRDSFGMTGAAPKRPSIVVVRCGGRRLGVVVDSLLGEHQTVIKPLAKVFSHVACISGSTILGSGDVALILDVPAILRGAEARGRELRGPRQGTASMAPAAG